VQPRLSLWSATADRSNSIDRTRLRAWNDWKSLEASGFRMVLPSRLRALVAGSGFPRLSHRNQHLAYGSGGLVVNCRKRKRSSAENGRVEFIRSGASSKLQKCNAACPRQFLMQMADFSGLRATSSIRWFARPGARRSVRLCRVRLQNAEPMP
jgi:hypothetical protein